MGKGRPLVALLLGIGMIGFGANMHLNQQSDVRNAVKDEATVQSIGVKDIGGETRQNPTASYEPVVEYTYTYEGEEYSSESVYPGPEKRFGSEESARTVVNQFSSGEDVTVYVNQEEPERAFLIKETGGNGVPIAMIAIGALFALSSISSLGKRLLTGKE